MSRIETLTPGQIARFDEFRDRWIRIGLCTEPANRPRAEAAIREMYRQGGLEPPAKIVWCGSPLSQCLTRAIILEQKLMPSIGDSVEGSVWGSVKASVDGSLRASVEDGVWASVGDSVAESVQYSVRDSVAESAEASVWASVDAGVWASVWASVWGSVRESVCSSLWDTVCGDARDSVWNSFGAVPWGPARPSRRRRNSVGESVGAGVWDSVYGAHDAPWLAFYRYFHDAVGLVDETAKLAGLWELAQSAGWALPHPNICWVCERHHILSRDDRGRLHCESGPAVAYPDGWAIYAVHGVRVPRNVIEHPHEIDIARIGAVRNAEVRRVMIDRYRHGEEVSGPAAFMRDAGGERLDHDERFGTLWRRNVPGDEPIVMIEVINSTREPDGRRKRYWLRVPPNMTTAHEAVAWSFNVPAKDYAPKVET
jgi:hypothetical protein